MWSMRWKKHLTAVRKQFGNTSISLWNGIKLNDLSHLSWLRLRNRHEQISVFLCYFVIGRIHFKAECWLAMRRRFFVILHGTIIIGWHHINPLSNNQSYHCVNRSICSTFVGLAGVGVPLSSTTVRSTVCRRAVGIAFLIVESKYDITLLVVL